MDWKYKVQCSYFPGETHLQESLKNILKQQNSTFYMKETSKPYANWKCHTHAANVWELGERVLQMCEKETINRWEAVNAKDTDVHRRTGCIISVSEQYHSLKSLFSFHSFPPAFTEPQKMITSELLDRARPFTSTDAHTTGSRSTARTQNNKQGHDFHKPTQHWYITKARKVNDHRRTPIILPVILCKTTLLSLRDVTVEAKAETKSILFTKSSVNSQV